MPLFHLLKHKAVLWPLALINLAGTLYGYYWYEPQLAMSKWYYYPFIPDSPTASLFFTIILFLWIFNRRSRLFEALAFVTLIKYGVWAVVMNALMLNELGTSDALFDGHGADADGFPWSDGVPSTSVCSVDDVSCQRTGPRRRLGHS